MPSSDRIGAFIDSSNAKNKYIPKKLRGNCSIHYKGQEFSMKELTKTKPLYITFLFFNWRSLHKFACFDRSYDKINIALDKENLINTIKVEIDSNIWNTYGTVIIINPMVQFQQDGFQILLNTFWPNAEKTQG